MITRIATLVLATLFFSSSAWAGANWESISFRTTPQNAPKVLAAADKFMASEIGKAFPGTVSLMLSDIDGADPSTHSFITSTSSFAESEAWAEKLAGNADWTAFMNALTELTEPGGNSRMQFQKSWGETNDSDVVWEIYAVSVSDGARFVAAMDALMASESGKKFPGSLHLSVVLAAGLTPVTHLVSAGFESAAEAEKWNDMLFASKDWAAFVKATDGVSDAEGTFILRTLKTWGTPPTLP